MKKFKSFIGRQQEIDVPPIVVLPGIPSDAMVICSEHGFDYESWCPGCNQAFDIMWAKAGLL